MSKYRLPTKGKQYYIPKEDYLTAVHYALRYPLWLAELNDARDTSTAIRYDKDNVQSSPSADMVFNAATKAISVGEKIKHIDSLISVSADGMDYYLRLAVCYGLTFDQLLAKDIPCGRRKFYEMRRKFYFLLSQTI